MKNIHLLPTDKLSRLVKFFSNKYHLCKEILPIQDEEQYQNIYITSEEDIGDGWSYDRMMKSIGKRDNVYSSKIILTTDPDLIKNGIQPIDDEFLEWFVKNPSCEFVEVKPLLSNNGRAFYGYKIIIPQEEPKTNLEKLPFPELVKEFVEYYENVPLTEEPKQETLEDSIYQAIGLAANEQGIINQALATSKVMDVLKKTNL